MKRISAHITIALLLLLSGCIKESAPNCESVLLLRFRYTLNDQYANLFDSEVHRVTIYIFDSKGKYVETYSEQGGQLTNDYVMRIPLPEGRYGIVAFGGDFTTYTAGELDNQTNILSLTLRKGITDISDLRVELKNGSGEENFLYPLSVPDDLYAGSVDNVESILNNQHVTDVELIKDTKKIKVKITSADPVAEQFDVYITSRNGRFRADNTIDIGLGRFKYLPVSSSVTPNRMDADLKIMRLTLDEPSMLVIRNRLTSETIYNKNMIDQILLTEMYISQEDFDREDEFVFEINVPSNFLDVGVSVTINGWEINYVIPDM